MQLSVQKSPKKAKMRAEGQAGAGGWDRPGWEWRALINNGNGYKMVGEGAGSREMAKNCPKKRKWGVRGQGQHTI